AGRGRGWRGRRAAAREPARDRGRSCGGRLLSTEHLEPDLLFRHLARVLADDLALVDDEDAVGERQDLLELERDEQDRAALVALRHQPAVKVLDGADVEAARGLRGDEHLGI